MNDISQKKRGSTLWGIADQLRGDSFEDSLALACASARIATETQNLEIFPIPTKG